MTRVTALGVAVLLGTAVACSVVVGRNGAQCETDADCRGLGPAFESTRCSYERVCVDISVPSLEAGVSDGGQACATNAECAAILNAPARCLDSKCVSLRSDDCTDVPGGDYTSENAVYIGVLAPLRGVNVNYGGNYVGAAATATRALNDNTSTVAGARPFVIVGCDESVDPARAATFLTSVVHVGAIVGPVFDAAFEATLPVTKQAGIPLLSPLMDNPKYVSTKNDDGLAWSCSPNRVDAVGAWNGAVNRIGEIVLDATGAPTFKVFLAASREPGVQAFAGALEPALRFNGGKSTVDNGANYGRGDYDYAPNAPAELSSIVGQVLAARPQVVLLPSLFGASFVIDSVESAWTTTMGPRPYYVVHRNDPTIALHAQLQTGKDRQRRIFALDWSRSTGVQTNAAQFAGAFAQLNNVPAAWLAETYYDCTYAYTYGGYAAVGRQGARFEAMLGTVFRNGVGVLSGPADPPKNVGSTDARSIVDTLLNTSSPLQVVGSATAFGFDLDRGAPRGTSDLLCVDATGSWSSTGVTYDAAGVATGTFECK